MSQTRNAHADSTISTSSAAPAQRRGQSETLDDWLAKVIAGDAAAWRRLVRELAPRLRRAIRETLESPTDDQVEDLLGDFWLRVLEDDMHLLRAFKRDRGADLGAWLTLHIYDTTTAHLRQQAREPATVPLSDDIAYDDPRQHIYMSRLLPSDATERFISALSTIYSRRLLVKLSEADSLPRATVDHD